MRQRRLQAASVTWGADGVPRSDVFGDVYFSSEGGWAESRHVFFDGCQIGQRWAGRHRFVIGETGFGSGRNFLLTWRAWLDDPQRPAILDFISVEGFPLAGDHARRALQKIADGPALSPLIDTLVAAWPVAQPGFHLRLFSGGRVRLLLLLGDVDRVLPDLRASVDAWYLDGFAPANNPDMWSPTLFARLAALSAPGARFATYTAAGHVRRALVKTGFSVAQRPGYGRKRTCLAGHWAGAGASATEQTPWYARPASLSAGSRVAVIGGGVAGTALVAAARRQGLEPVLFERHDTLAREGSGNPCAMLTPRLTADDGIHGRFYAQAALYAQAILPSWVWVQRGLLQVARDANEVMVHKRLAHALPEGHARSVDRQQAWELAQVDAPCGGIWFPFAGTVRPQQVCQALIEDIPEGDALRIVRGKSVFPARAENGGWLVGGECFAAVVLAAGPHSRELWPAAELPIHAKRGQLSFIAEKNADTTQYHAAHGDVSTPRADLPVAGLSFGGYLSPSLSDPRRSSGRIRVLGATYQRWTNLGDDGWQTLSDDDHDSVIESLRSVLPAVSEQLNPRENILGGRAALRASIADHMPVAGPLFDAAHYRCDFADLHHGRRPNTYPTAHWEPGLYILAGLGSRGFQTAPLLAEYLVALMTGGPLPLPQDVSEAIHPARFLVRSLRKAPHRRKPLS